MSDCLEFRVFTGSQAGCRLPLKPGLYRVGAAPASDILLEGYPQGRTAFVLHIGHQEVALETVDVELRLGGQPTQGLCPLGAGDIFTLGGRLFAVDYLGAAWPENPVAPPFAALATGEQEAPVANEPLAAETPIMPIVPAPPDPAPSSVSSTATLRWRLPFWVLWLGGTTAFLGVGILVLFLSLRPVETPEQPDHGRIVLELEQLIATTRGHAELRLEPQSGGHLKLAGHVATRAQKAELARAARAVTPFLALQVSADEDMETLVRDTLVRFKDLRIELARLRFGELTLKGHVAESALRDRVGEALFEDVPGLRLIHAEITTVDDALAALLNLLAEAGLEGRMTGRPDGNRLIVDGSLSETERRTWSSIRRRLAARFGTVLEIVENFRATAVVQQGAVVLAVHGEVPYVMFTSGAKEGRRAEDMP